LSDEYALFYLLSPRLESEREGRAGERRRAEQAVKCEGLPRHHGHEEADFGLWSRVCPRTCALASRACAAHARGQARTWR